MAAAKLMDIVLVDVVGQGFSFLITMFTHKPRRRIRGEGSLLMPEAVGSIAEVALGKTKPTLKA